MDTVLDLPLLEPVRTGTVREIGLLKDARGDSFGLELYGAVEAPQDGVYTFTTESDDGSRLYIGDVLVVDNDHPHGATAVSGSISLRAGRHPIYIAYFGGIVDEVLRVTWSGPGVEDGFIPASALSQYPQVVSFTQDGLTTTELAWPDRAYKLNVRVDTRDAESMKGFHQVIPDLLREHYPTIVDLIAVEGDTLPEEIRLRFRSGIEVPAYASNGIVLSAEWFATHPNDLGCVLHEVTHLVQRYPSFRDKPGWLVEGIADYVRHVIGLDDGWRVPEGYREGMSYTDGYGATAAFLTYLEEEHGPGVVRGLNASLKDRTYSPDLFVQLTGTDLDSLWEAYRLR